MACDIHYKLKELKAHQLEIEISGLEIYIRDSLGKRETEAWREAGRRDVTSKGLQTKISDEQFEETLAAVYEKRTR